MPRNKKKRKQKIFEINILPKIDSLLIKLIELISAKLGIRDKDLELDNMLNYSILQWLLSILKNDQLTVFINSKLNSSVELYNGKTILDSLMNYLFTFVHLLSDQSMYIDSNLDVTLILTVISQLITDHGDLLIYYLRITSTIKLKYNSIVKPSTVVHNHIDE